MSSFDPSRPELAPYGFTCERWTLQGLPRPDRHNEIELNFLPTGSLSYLLGGHKATLRAGRMAAFWAVMPHQVIGAENNPEYFVVTIPLVCFLQFRLPERLTHRLLHGMLVVDPSDENAASDLRMMEQWSRDLAAGQVDQQKAALLEIEARLLRLALALPELQKKTPVTLPQGPALDTGGLSKSEQIAAYVARHYTERLTASQIGQAVGLHPNYAMAVFRKAFNTTLIEFITQHRLSHAQRLLVTTNDTVLKIALEAGFGSVNRFNQVFKQCCGCTPVQYRQRFRIISPSSALRYNENLPGAQDCGL